MIVQCAGAGRRSLLATNSRSATIELIQRESLLLGGDLDVRGGLGAGDDHELPAGAKHARGGADPVAGELQVATPRNIDIAADDLRVVARVVMLAGVGRGVPAKPPRWIGDHRVDVLVEVFEQRDGVTDL